MSFSCKPAPTSPAQSQQVTHKHPPCPPRPPLQPPGPSQAPWQPAASFSGLPIKLMVTTSRSQAITNQRNNSDDRGDHTDPGPAPLEGVCAPSQLQASPQFQSLQLTAEVMEAQRQTVTCPGPPSWQGLPQHAPPGPEPTLPPPPGLGGVGECGHSLCSRAPHVRHAEVLVSLLSDTTNLTCFQMPCPSSRQTVDAA